MKIEIPGSTDSTYDVSEKRDEQSQAPQAARARAAGGEGWRGPGEPGRAHGPGGRAVRMWTRSQPGKGLR